MKFQNLDTHFSDSEFKIDSELNIIDPLSTYEDPRVVSKNFLTESAELNIIDRIFSLKDRVILNEKWDNSYLLSGRINALSENFVSCETIIDKVHKETQIRNYPIKQFAHLPFLKVGKTVKIKINEKPGSFRIDIIDGSNTGIEKEFESMQNWDQLNDFKMDDPADLHD